MAFSRCGALRQFRTRRSRPRNRLVAGPEKSWHHSSRHKNVTPHKENAHAIELWGGHTMTTSNRRRFLTLTAAALATPALPRLSLAQAWPAGKPIRAVVPFSAGSTVDIIARIVLDPLSQQLGQTILVENRGGAGGSIGSAAVAKADPDGYTLLVNAAAHSAAPAAFPHITYDPAKDFAAVAMFGVVPNVLLVAPSLALATNSW